MAVVYTLVALVLFIQLLFLIPPSCTALLNLITRLFLHRMRIRFKIRGTFIICLPGMFWGRNLRVYYHDLELGEEHFIELDRIYFFWPLYSLWGRIWIAPVHLDGLYNRIRVYKTVEERQAADRPLPPIGRVFFSEVEISDSRIEVEDETLAEPPVVIDELQIRGGFFDLAAPFSVLLLSRTIQLYFTDAHIDGQWDRSSGQGRFKVRNLDLKQLAGLGALLINTGHIDLDFKYTVSRDSRNHEHFDGRSKLAIENFSHVFDSQFKKKQYRDSAIQNALMGNRQDRLYAEIERQEKKKGGFKRIYDASFSIGNLEGDWEKSMAAFVRIMMAGLTVAVVKPGIESGFRRLLNGLGSLFSGGSSSQTRPDEGEGDQPGKSSRQIG